MKFYFNLQLIIPSDLLNIIFQQKMQYLVLYFEQNYANLLIKDCFCFYMTNIKDHGLVL